VPARVPVLQLAAGVPELRGAASLRLHMLLPKRYSPNLDQT